MYINKLTYEKLKTLLKVNSNLKGLGWGFHALRTQSGLFVTILKQLGILRLKWLAIQNIFNTNSIY